MARITVLGAGSWGTALAVLLLEQKHDVCLWSHRREQVAQMREQGENRDKLPGFILPDKLLLTADLEKACHKRDLLILAVPSRAMRQTAESIASFIDSGQRLLCVSKGIEEESLYTQSMILSEVLPQARLAVLSGPSHAEEVIRGIPTLVVVASKDRELALFVQDCFMNLNFRVYISPDLIGVEIGGALKNVIALAAGMSDGVGYGDNSKAALITRGMKEMSQLAEAMGGEESTLSGLSGMGDLIVTCQSKHSRNRKAGFLIGQGFSLLEAKKQIHMVVEGVDSAKAALALGKKYGVDLPIIEQVNRVLFEGLDVKEGVTTLMGREAKKERDSLRW